MGTVAVARKEILDTIRSRSLIVLVVTFTVFAGGATYFLTAWSGSAGETNPVVRLIFSLGTPILIFVPPIGVLMGYKSIAGERETGSAKLILSLPNTRHDVVIGKVIGRIAVLASAILVGLVVSAAIAFWRYDSLPLGEYGLFSIATVLLGVVYLSFSLGLSAATDSTSIALWGSLGFLLVFQYLWKLLVNLLVYVINGFGSPAHFSPLGGYSIPRYGGFTPPDWYQLLVGLSPLNAYQRAYGALLNTQYVSQSGPYYLDNWFGLVVLGIWIVIPLVVGYVHFHRNDL